MATNSSFNYQANVRTTRMLRYTLDLLYCESKFKYTLKYRCTYQKPRINRVNVTSKNLLAIHTGRLRRKTDFTCCLIFGKSFKCRVWCFKRKGNCRLDFSTCFLSVSPMPNFYLSLNFILKEISLYKILVKILVPEYLIWKLLIFALLHLLKPPQSICLLSGKTIEGTNFLSIYIS